MPLLVCPAYVRTTESGAVLTEITWGCDAVMNLTRCKNLGMIRCTLLTVTIIFGFIIAARTLLGPITFPFRVTNPLIPEGWFGLALMLTMLVTENAADNAARETETRSQH